MDVSAAPAPSPVLTGVVAAEPAVVPADRGSGAGFAHQPALDGVRGLAVAAVVLFHAGFGWISGGYVGVSVFFTLSGYLITSLALHEWGRTGRLDAVAFYSRRIRRLLPASLICLAGVIVAAFAGAFDDVTRIRRDLWAALAQVYNWVALASGEDYATQMARAAGQRAPLDHYWSLAIEEQFYWVWPLALLVILRGGRRRRLVAVAGLLAVFSISTFVIAAAVGDGATYLATPARLPEILSGALLAVVLFSWPAAASVRRPVAGVLSSVVGLGVIGWAAVMWPARSGPAYDGWLPVFSLASVAVIAGLQVRSPVRAALSWRPLVELGKISYGVYLFHWPIFTLIDERLIDTSRAVLFAVRMTVTLAVAVLSYRLVEVPIRRHGKATVPGFAAERRRTFDVAGASCIAMALVIALVPDRGGSFTKVADETIAAVAIRPITPDAVLPPVTRRAVRVLVMGDSTAWALGFGMMQWAYDHPGEMQVTSVAAVGCGLNMGGEFRDDGYTEICRQIQGGLVGNVERLRPDVVVAMVTYRDIEDRQWTEEEGMLEPTDPRFQAHLLDGYAFLSAQLLDAGASHVVWVMPPIPRVFAYGELAEMVDPARYAAYHAVLDELAASAPGQVTVADVAAWIDGLDEPPDSNDGLHWSVDGAVHVTDDFLAPLIRDVVSP